MIRFFDDIENQTVLKICRTSPGFIPIVISGRLHPVREANIADYPVSSSLSAEDFVLGLEVLGCRFEKDGNDDFAIVEPKHFKSEIWMVRATRIRSAFNDSWFGRRIEISDFLAMRKSSDDQVVR